MSLFDTGVRPAIDAYLKKKSEELRDYGDYWSASSAGYCQRLVIMRRLGVPKVPELADDQARTTRVFEAGHLFHEWIQRITKDAGLSIASEVELQDEDLMIRGHFDDLVLIPTPIHTDKDPLAPIEAADWPPKPKLILYDYKTSNSKSFNYPKPNIGYYHKMQLGTYMYMLRNNPQSVIEIMADNFPPPHLGRDTSWRKEVQSLTEARILTIEKDTLRMREQDLHWSTGLEQEVLDYWRSLNENWKAKRLPKCTCLQHDGGWLGRRTKAGKIYGDYIYEDQPCSTKWAAKHKELFKGWKVAKNDTE